MDMPDPTDIRPCRRTVLRGAAAAGMLGVPLLAGCGSAEPTAAPTEGTSSTSGGGSAGGGGAGGAALGAVSQVPVGGGRIYAKQQVVVTQPKKGEFKAFSATCTHMGCTVGSVEDGTINCPCHGSQFDMTTGNPVHGPASKPLPPADVSVKGGQITLT